MERNLIFTVEGQGNCCFLRCTYELKVVVVVVVVVFVVDVVVVVFFFLNKYDLLEISKTSKERKEEKRKEKKREEKKRKEKKRKEKKRKEKKRKEKKRKEKKRMQKHFFFSISIICVTRAQTLSHKHDLQNLHNIFFSILYGAESTQFIFC